MSRRGIEGRVPNPSQSAPVKDKKKRKGFQKRGEKEVEGNETTGCCKDGQWAQLCPRYSARWKKKGKTAGEAEGNVED